jgi:hypothetical protein
MNRDKGKGPAGVGLDKHPRQHHSIQEENSKNYELWLCTGIIEFVYCFWDTPGGSRICFPFPLAQHTCPAVHIRYAFSCDGSQMSQRPSRICSLLESVGISPTILAHNLVTEKFSFIEYWGIEIRWSMLIRKKTVYMPLLVRNRTKT